ncbi:7,8-dihydro-8-oxoguanine-triphosphatase [Maritimibacter sp. 55A14]|uniref:NUDIX domain-containing protein n=1 Tax=Maritimibacter sp. 55A14 TaxID=2174844 RepID=UPI000D61A95E|nr:NUDIX domain-containing protein [Maritimibacter sp. 55A14]PWE32306.1 7,8-dihydro-8-oxoguanine-triphosphatase [Maritimibacter sp. 55A14]
MIEGFRPIGLQPETVRWRAALVLAGDAAGRALLQLRDDRPDVPGAGCWSFFGGAVESGEGLVAAARREFAEETGVTLPADAFRPLACCAAVSRGDGLLHVFAATRPIEPAEIVLGEGAGFAFLTRAQCLDFPLVPQIRRILLETSTETGWPLV